MTENLNTAWRQIASTIYKKPNDSKIFGSVEIDVTDLEIYIEKKRKEGLKIQQQTSWILSIPIRTHFEFRAKVAITGPAPLETDP